MKKTNSCDIERVLTIAGEVLRGQEFMLGESVFNKISPKLPKIDRNFQQINQKSDETIFVREVIRNIFIPVVMGALLLILTFRFFGVETFFYIPVELKLKNISAKQVEVVGDFTNWKPVKLKNQKGCWRTKFYLKPGTYRYIYIIDGETYFLEPGQNVVEDDFGNKNSVIII